MRIALVHSFYSSQQPSGENQVVVAQVDALREAGHEVLLVARYTDPAIQERGYSVRAALGVATGFGPDPTADLRDFSPDVVHIHNLFPNFGTRWVSRWEGPLVATLHNYRPLCANGLLYRDGHNCTLCPEGDRLASMRYGCYRDSRIATLPLALRNARPPQRSWSRGHSAQWSCRTTLPGRSRVVNSTSRRVVPPPAAESLKKRDTRDPTPLTRSTTFHGEVPPTLPDRGYWDHHSPEPKAAYGDCRTGKPSGRASLHTPGLRTWRYFSYGVRGGF